MIIKFLKDLYEATMDKMTPTFQDFDVDDEYNEDRITPILLDALDACREDPANLHCVFTIWYHPLTNTKTFTIRAKSRNHNWRMRRSFFTSVENELRYY